MDIKREDVDKLPSPSSSSPSNELADKYKLSAVKELFIEGYPEGKILSWGTEVRHYPVENRFRIRIYDRHRGNDGMPRRFIQMDINTFYQIKKNENSIVRNLCTINLNRSKTIIDENGFSVHVVPSTIDNKYPDLMFSCRGTRIYMNQRTFENMMSYEKQLQAAYDKYSHEKKEDQQLIDEFLNVMAYNKNEGKTNDWVSEPAYWYKGGAVTTWKKLMEQVKKSKEKIKIKRLNEF